MVRLGLTDIEVNGTTLGGGDNTVFQDFLLSVTPTVGYDLFVNGGLVASGSAIGVVAENRLQFGDGSSWANAEAEMTAYTFRQVPEPATLALMGLGLAGIGWRRKVSS